MARQGSDERPETEDALEAAVVEEVKSSRKRKGIFGRRNKKGKEEAAPTDAVGRLQVRVYS